MKSVLLVEDNPIIVTILTKVIARRAGEDVEIIVAKNGKEAIEVAETHAPAVILLDWMMPDYDGAYFLEQQKTLSTIQEIPVVIYTALDESRVKIDPNEYPTVVARLQKPTSPAAIYETLEAFL